MSSNTPYRRSSARKNPPGARVAPLLSALYLLDASGEMSNLLPYGSHDYWQASLAGALVGARLKATDLARRHVHAVAQRAKLRVKTVSAAVKVLRPHVWDVVASWARQSPIFSAYQAFQRAHLAAEHEKFVDSWIESDKSPRAVRITRAVEEKKPAKDYKYAKTAYAITQETTPWTTRTLYRGVGGEQAAAIRSGRRTLATKALSSWSDNENVPQRYAEGGVRVAVKVPKSRVFLSHEVFGDRAGDSEYILQGKRFHVDRFDPITSGFDE